MGCFPSKIMIKATNSVLLNILNGDNLEVDLIKTKNHVAVLGQMW